MKQKIEKQDGASQNETEPGQAGEPDKMNGKKVNGSVKFSITAKVYPGAVRIEVTDENKERVYYGLKDAGIKLVKNKMRF